MALLDAVLDFRKRGYYPIPVLRGSKNPIDTEWQNLRLDEAAIRARFAGPSNVGLLLGITGLYDVDVDCREALAIAERRLPATGWIHGRKGNPRRHFTYLCEEVIPSEKFKDPFRPATKGLPDDDGTAIIELRGSGGQTIYPPSMNGKEKVEWYEHGNRPGSFTRTSAPPSRGLPPPPFSRGTGRKGVGTTRRSRSRGGSPGRVGRKERRLNSSLTSSSRRATRSPAKDTFAVPTRN